MNFVMQTMLTRCCLHSNEGIIRVFVNFRKLPQTLVKSIIISTLTFCPAGQLIHWKSLFVYLDPRTSFGRIFFSQV